MSAPLLEAEGLTRSYLAGGFFSRERKPILKGVSFSLQPGEIVALVGESGSGKSTLARLLARLDMPDSGRLRLAGRDVLADGGAQASLDYRGRVQMVFQDPFASLNPVHTVAYHLERPLVRHGRVPKSGLRTRVLSLLESVGLTPAEAFAKRYPHELSGGQRQRVAVARALAVEPQVIIADEPTSMLDVSTRKGVLQLLRGLTQERGIGILFITHDLASARHLADRILVLYAGTVVEAGRADEVLRQPRHPYTKLLLSAVPDGDDFLQAALPVRPTTQAPPLVGCPFAPRCPVSEPRCSTLTPPDVLPAANHLVRCHLEVPKGVTADASVSS
ncbi:ABC transporter ATP-binding protein [Corallococcus sp. AB049A]|uniref:ABC transporter ATP-binding protein n=1 Tax=Corallococcus interemptor TaxID=2316720 RepID=A0A3A8QJS1_9BACT|nr:MULTISPECIES: ABC transporter ATP-binding protein [Corallococcus]RKH49863.1 ABC transporter ATP-binding protein [Corallococcus sp. AB050B]RKH67160.1 ABC transporter ATP-binding protein [Corallococcus interemptor]RKI72031.1 ABC transporter ATP-binding protein [Corallococcus sp. AB049A]